MALLRLTPLSKTNTIAGKAAEGTASEPLLAELKGMCSIAYTTGDPVALAKALTVYAKENPAFTFKAGMVQGRVVDVTGINALATLPSKEEIFAKLLWVINAPAQQLVTVTNAVARNLAVVVDQGVKENKFPALCDSDGLWRLLVSITIHKLLHVVRDQNRKKRESSSFMA